MALCFFLNGRSTELAIPIRMVFVLLSKIVLIMVRNYCWWASNESISSITIIFVVSCYCLRTFAIYRLRSFSSFFLSLTCSSLKVSPVISWWRSDQSFWQNFLTSLNDMALYRLILREPCWIWYSFGYVLNLWSTRWRVEVLPVPGCPHKYIKELFFSTIPFLRNSSMNFCSLSLV